jgi:tetratricopeptide (TPR) repeat protein
VTELEKAKAAIARGNDARFLNPAEAHAAFAEAAAIYRALKLQAELANALSRQARIERDAKNYDQALASQMEALALVRTTGDRHSLARALRHLADILGDAGRHSEADPYFHEMLALYRELPDLAPLDVANAVRSAAEHARHMGRNDEARRLWQEARERYAALDAVFLELTGKNDNPGVREADRRLASLGN